MSELHTVLVVEDNDFVRLQISTFLKEAGYAVIEAREGEAALAAVNENKISGHARIDMAIVDVRMEPLGGFEFLRVLRSKDDNLPAILVTGDQSTDLLEQANKFGVGAVLMKPIQKERLLMTVQRTLKTAGRAR